MALDSYSVPVIDRSTFTGCKAATAGGALAAINHASELQAAAGTVLAPARRCCQQRSGVEPGWDFPVLHSPRLHPALRWLRPAHSTARRLAHDILVP